MREIRAKLLKEEIEDQGVKNRKIQKKMLLAMLS